MLEWVAGKPEGTITLQPMSGHVLLPPRVTGKQGRGESPELAVDA